MLCDDWIRSLFEPMKVLSARNSFSEISLPLYWIRAWDVYCIIKIPKVADKNGESCISILEKIA